MIKRAYAAAATMFLILILCTFLFVPQSNADTCVSGQRTFNFINNCGFTVWVGGHSILDPTPVPSWNWRVNSGTTQTMCIPEAAWNSGRFWARTGCAFDSSSVHYPTCTTSADCSPYQGVNPVCYQGVCVKQGCQFNTDCIPFIGDNSAQCTNGYCLLPSACDLGDCNGLLNCQSGGSTPSTLNEFQPGVAGTSVDNYDLSTVDGPGIPLEIAVIPNTTPAPCNNLGCVQAGPNCPAPCVWDANSKCPPELQILSNSVVVGCLAPQDYCSRNPNCKSGGDPTCTANSDCCSGSCVSGTCAVGSSIDCNKAHSMGVISCTQNSDCPVLGANLCGDYPNYTCPTGTTCQIINTEALCVMNCNPQTNTCQALPCTTNADCAPSTATCNGITKQCSDGSGPCDPTRGNYDCLGPLGALYGQPQACDLTPNSPTINTCQPSSWSLYACNGINHTSCKGTGSYGTSATWCCGCSSWQQADGECQAVNPTWAAVAEPFAALFHNSCPTAYSFPYDDKVLLTCLGDAGGAFGYDVTFCPTAAPSTYKLTVTPTGTGTGTVTSSPSGINCGSTCSASFTAGATVTLTAVAGKGYAFDNWSGCTSTSGTTCTVVINGTTTVAAAFNKPPSISVNAKSINLGNVKKGVTSATKTVIIKNTGVGQLWVTATTITGSTEFIASNNCTSGMDKNETCQVTVSILASSYGKRTGTLQIASNDPVHPTVSVSLTATAVAPKMSVSPTSINFGTVTTDDTSTKPIKIKNTGLSALTVGPVSTPADASFTVDASGCTSGSIAQNATCTINVTFDPATAGTKSSSFTIGSNASATPTTVKLSGKGK